MVPLVAGSSPARHLMLDTLEMGELSAVEQRYQAVLAVISDGLSVSQVPSKVGCRAKCLSF